MKILAKGHYYGTKQSDWSIPGIVLSEYSYLIPRTDWHYHENPYFMYVLHGELLDVNKQTLTHCPSGSFLFHNWQETHYNSKESSQARGFHIEFDRSWFEEKRLDISLWEGSQLLENPFLHHLFAKLYYEYSVQDSYSMASIELLLLELCEHIHIAQSPSATAIPPWIDNLKELLHDDTHPLNLSYLSEQLGVHPVHLSRSVPKYLSTTLGEYIRRQRIKTAVPYLLNSSYSLTEIAHTCGFADQSHFTRIFKSYFGKTPRVFRKGFC